ncbi:cell wall synthase accessory phosphoprotein MacP [Streptococcus respiraculi]|uniref:cell wall synthase accessory phosphoprotein MacP n=1 Tax=Streptococcus respiraculi TaxID=2021971 RepID=UPI000E75A636|nr:cell wall synthase accessory phosphoprotein MacP [Streptococcus respiraculi]
MRKPLLTDELLEELEGKKRPSRSQRFGYYDDDPEEEFDDVVEFDAVDEWEDEYTGYREGYTHRIPVDASIIKSRRIETVKREEFRSKINKILFWVVLLVILFLIAVFFW